MLRNRELVFSRLGIVLLVAAFAASASAQWTTSGTNIFNSNTGNVGVGTTTPIVKLQSAGTVLIGGEGSSFGAARLALGGSHGDAGTIGYGYLPTSTSLTYVYQSLCSCDPAAQLYFLPDKVQFRLAPAGVNGNTVVWTTPMAVTRTRIGIHNSNPAFPLDVVGEANFSSNVFVAGNIAAKYQDVAEWVPADEDLNAGTVVVLDERESNRVMTAEQAYDTRVAGVVSSKPGLILGEAADNKEMIATTGRVKVKVDATKGPIRIGDLLVTSETAGYAMRSEPISIGGARIHRPGTIIGKALEPLESGRGEILVLLSLQ